VIEKGIRRRTIVTPDGDPQTPGLNELNCVIERNHVVRRTSLGGTIRLISRRRLTFVLVRQARYLDIAELKVPHQTFENHQSLRALHSIVVEMSVSGENYIDRDGGKLA
jgi:hypothetical protein